MYVAFFANCFSRNSFKTVSPESIRNCTNAQNFPLLMASHVESSLCPLSEMPCLPQNFKHLTMDVRTA